MKTAGVDASILRFAGTARVCESQDAAVEAILTNKIKPGDVVVVIYEGPRGGPGMQEMLYPTSYLKSKDLGGLIDLVRDGDRIEIDIPARSIHLAVDEAELKRRREAMQAKGAQAFRPAKRNRKVSTALKAYAALATSAARGAVRVVRD